MSVWLRYLGTGDRFEDQGKVLVRDGDPVEVDDDRAEVLRDLPGEQFEVASDEDVQAYQEREAAATEAASKRAEARAEAEAEREAAAEADAAARAGYYGAETQEEADAAVAQARSEEPSDAKDIPSPAPDPQVPVTAEPGEDDPEDGLGGYDLGEDA